MDEDEKNFLPFEKLRLVLLEHWRRAGVPPNCELCGNGQWSVVRTDEHDGLSILFRSGDELKVPDLAYMVFALECQNCGNVRMFSKAAVDRTMELTEEGNIDAGIEGLDESGSED